MLEFDDEIRKSLEFQFTENFAEKFAKQIKDFKIVDCRLEHKWSEKDNV